MKRIILPSIIILLGFALPYYWNSITEVNLEVQGHVLSNIVGLTVGLIVYGSTGKEYCKVEKF